MYPLRQVRRRMSERKSKEGGFMKNKSFIALWLIASAMVVGVMIENVRNVSVPQESKAEADSGQVKEKIRKAGIIPHEAKYWKEL